MPLKLRSSNFFVLLGSFLLICSTIASTQTMASQMPFAMGGGEQHGANAGQGSDVNPSAFSTSAQGSFGILLQEVNSQYYKLPARYGKSGVYAAYVMSGMLAESAGLKTGDIILELDGSLITGISGFENVFPIASADGSLDIKIFRNGKEETRKAIISVKQTGQSQTEISKRKTMGPGDVMASMRPPQASKMFENSTSGYKKHQPAYSQNYPGMFIEDMINKSPIRYFTKNKKVNLDHLRNGNEANHLPSSESNSANSSRSKSLKKRLTARLEIALSAIRLKRELKLTDSQVEKLKEISHTFRIQNIRTRADMEVAKLELEQVFSSEKIDENKVKNMLESISNLRIKHTLSMIKMIKDAEKNLADQMGRLKTLLGIQ